MKSILFSWLLFCATMGQQLHAQSIPVSTQVQLDFREKGKGNPTTILFLHGFSDSWFSYSEILDKLPRKYHSIALSLRGHGDSPKPPTGYSPDDMAKDIVHFLNKRGIDKVIVVGHSMGSTVAMQLAIRYPERTHALILLAAFATFNDKTFMPSFVEAIEQLKDPVDINFIKEFQESTILKPVPPAFMKNVINESRKLTASVWKETIQSLIKADYENRLSAYTKPVLLIWGDADQMALEDDQQRLLKAFPNVRLLRYESIGHAVHWEAPDRVARDIKGFLEFIQSSPE
ncbi:alpha/beta fold hydrolase [Flavihumibacter sp. UBA7668]|uniref:alpha/beta fold hydrolase n=1 Tax=Flavihumibacter sp. UBA7668 TaxID=1946542 RepID=UPI0025BD4DBC|nr:alpha/beta hydrolase [Flavihumibacter sp. UBA7668]